MEIIIFFLTISIFIFYIYKRDFSKKIEIATVEEKDDTQEVEYMSDTQYLLEAGRGMWRLHSEFYSNHEYLLIYTLSLLYNNSFEQYSKIKLQSMSTRIRLLYLLNNYTDTNKPIDEQLKQLEQVLIESINELPLDLQVEYNLEKSNENKSSSDILNTLTLISDAG